MIARTPTMLALVIAAAVVPVGLAGAGAGADSFVLRAGRIYTAAAGQADPIRDGYIVVRDGRIAAVGADITPPADLPLLNYPDATICPGFVAAASYIAARHSGDETVSGAYRAADAFDRYGRFRWHLSRGITTAHLSPGGHRLVSGVGCVAKLGGPPDARLLAAEADLDINLGQFNPPRVVHRPFYASADVAIEPAIRQRPTSRMGQLLELRERLARGPGDAFDYHARTFAELWRRKLPLRFQARRAVDIAAALRLLKQTQRPAYLVGATQADKLVDALADAGLPVVLRLEDTYDRPSYTVGDAPDALENRLDTPARIAAQTKLALAGRDGEYADLRMIALLAMRGGLDPAAALAAITRVPAEILGVGDRVGSLEVGKDADLLVLSGDPLDVASSVLQAYICGQRVFEAPHSDALVIRAGAIWVGDGRVLHDASLLVEDGKIQAVGNRVPQPPGARVVDMRPGGFVSPGFIDAFGHLGLDGDRTRVGPDAELHRVIGAAERQFLRVARAGVTTVLLAAYRPSSSGARLAAIKTYGPDRAALVARPIAGLEFPLSSKDPLLIAEAVKPQFERGKKYVEKWKKYYEELAKWKRDHAAGKKTKAKQEVVTEVQAAKVDPITGTWEYTISGGPIPEPVTATMQLRLTGNEIEGRMFDPTGGGDDQVITGTLEGDQVHLEIEQDTPFGNPVIECTLDRDDHMAGQVKIGDILTLDFEATRTDKSPVEFKVKRKHRRSKDGRPTPPKRDPALEPYRDLLAGRIPAVVDVQSAAQIAAVLKVFVDEQKVPVVLRGAAGAPDAADELQRRKDKIGVVVSPQLVTSRGRKPYVPVADLGRRGLSVAFESDAEDGARSLPLMALFAVGQGMGGDAALRALTIDAARMYKLDDRVGTLEPGKDADILIHSGYPLDAGSRLERVFVGGVEVPVDDD